MGLAPALKENKDIRWTDVWHLEEDLKHVRTLLPDSSVYGALSVLVSAVWVCATLKQKANHLRDVSSVTAREDEIEESFAKYKDGDCHLSLVGVDGKEKSI